MAKALFVVLFKVIKVVLDIFLLPINALIVNFVPSWGNTISYWTQHVSSELGNGAGYFVNILPPTTQSILEYYLLFLISYYTISIGIHAVLKVIHIIKAIKVW